MQGGVNNPPVLIMLKKSMRCMIIIALTFLYCAQSFTQSNLRTVYKKNLIGLIIKDSLTIFPGSINILSLPSGKEIKKEYYTVSKTEIYLNEIIESDSILKIEYRVLDLPAFKPLFRLDTSMINKTKVNPFYAYQFSPDNKEQGLDLGSLDYRGSISRSILTGNNQDLSLNSNLNLQISGMLDKETEVAAVITDNNIPIQPDGATRQIQEFDKIFIRVKRKTTTLLAGDYEINSPEGYFMKYYKKLRGATLSNRFDLNKNMSLNSRASFAISRGKFSRMNIQGIEGNQGPYKLIGAEGESFIIVLAGTEKVYLDGIPMQRGLQDDYVIDYNRGDISFTSKKMITKDSRIIIEFEYSVQNYLRSLVTVSESFKIKRSVISFNLYTEQDSKTAQGNLKLTAEEKMALAAAGDSLKLAVIQSVDTSSIDPVKYRLVDTLGYKNVLVYDKALNNLGYTASFSFLGMGNGNYILDTEAEVNGRVYKWIAPEGGIKKGSYEPIKQLIAPTLQQMATFGIQTQLSSKMQLISELAYSRLDKNRFSELDTYDDGGYAAKVILLRTDTVLFNNQKWNLGSSINYEHLSKYFKPINPYRAAEFNRDFNYSPQATDENWVVGNIAFSNLKTFKTRYAYNYFDQSTFGQAQRHELDASYNKNNWELNFSGSSLNSTNSFEKTNYLKSKSEISKTIKQVSNLTLKVFAETESNERHNPLSDTLLANSFQFLTLGASASVPWSQDRSSNITYQHRVDFLPLSDGFNRQTIADQLALENTLKLNARNNLVVNIQYRKLNIVLPGNNLNSGENYLVRVQHNYQAPKGNITNALSYEIGSGQEQKIDFYYQEVKAGDGQYEYNDYNNDGVKQLDEFELAVNIENAKYVRLVLLSNEFVRTNNIEINENLLLSFPEGWSKREVWRKLLQKFSINNAGQISRKLKSANFEQVWNAFSEFNEENQLALLNYYYNNVLYFNRGKSDYEIQLGINGNTTKQLLSSGLEGRYLQEYFHYARFSLSKAWILEYKITSSVSGSEAQLFKSRSFRINSFKTEPGISWNVTRNARFSLKSKFERSKDTDVDNPADLQLFQGVLEGKINTNEKSSIVSKFTFSEVSFNGNVSSPSGFSLLQGLRNGNNFQWNLEIDYRLTKKMYLNGGYEGRKLGDGKVIHVLRMQVKAEF